MVLNPTLVLNSHPRKTSMPDHDTPTDGPISLQEFEKRLTEGQMINNTRVRMPDGQEWMLLPSFTRSEPVPAVQIRHLARLRRETAYRSARWLVIIVAWLCCVPAVALVFSERFSAWLFRGVEGEPPDLAMRLGCALFFGLTGLLVQCGGAMLVDRFDLRLATHVSRVDRSEK